MPKLPWLQQFYFSLFFAWKDVRDQFFEWFSFNDDNIVGQYFFIIFEFIIPVLLDYKTIINVGLYDRFFNIYRKLIIIAFILKMPRYQTVMILNYYLLDFYSDNNQFIFELFKKSLVSFNEEVGEISFGVLNMGLKNYTDFSKFEAILQRFKLLSLYKVLSDDFKKERRRNQDMDKFSHSIIIFSNFMSTTISDLENNKPYECYKKIQGRIKSKDKALFLFGVQELKVIYFCGSELHKKVVSKLKSIASHVMNNDTKYEDFELSTDWNNSQDELNNDNSNEDYTDDMMIEYWCNIQNINQQSHIIIQNITDIFHIKYENMELSSDNNSSDNTSSSLDYSSFSDDEELFENPLYNVEAVWDFRIFNTKLQYLIKWKDYENPTWTNAEECDCQNRINDFWATEAQDLENIIHEE